MRKRLPLTLLALVLCVGRLLAFEWEVSRIDGRDYISLKKIAEFYTLPQDVAPAQGRVYLQQGARSLGMTRDMREVDLNGVRYVLAFPIIERDGTFWVSRMDLAKTIAPALQPDLVDGVKPFTTVVLDAGHGGQDNGARGPYEVEKNFTLDMVRRVRNELQNAGVNVFLTRNDDKFVELADRAAIANSKRNSIFVSIHFNAADWNLAANGLEIYCITPRGAPSTEYDQLLVRDMVAETGNQNEMQSFVLASSIYHSLQGGTLDMADRGVKRARFAVLRLTKNPAVLIEGGFLTNADDARRIASKSWRDAYAKAIARGILEYKKLAEIRRVPRTADQYRHPGVVPGVPPAPAGPTATPAANPLKLQDLPQ